MSENFGIRISKPGVNVDEASSSQLVLDSNVDTLKVIKSGSVNLTISGGGGTASVYHGLNRICAFLIYYGDGTDYLIDFPNAFFTGSGRESSGVDIGAKINKNKLNIEGRGTNGTYSVFYEIFEQGKP